MVAELASSQGAPSSERWAPGAALLGRLRLERRLGEGGMGIVWETWDRRLHTRVALKMLRRVDPHALVHFKQEFRLLADVSHENLVRLFELFSADDDWFFTMELVRGETFLRALRPEVGSARSSAGPDAPTQVGWQDPDLQHAASDAGAPLAAERLPWLRSSLAQLCAGVRALHQTGKLHRDLKPSNVLVTSAGRVVVVDFGLAQDIGRNAGLTRFAGTVAYMAPEQADGHIGAPAADWYSIGVMLHEALSGRLPFGGTATEILAAKQTREPPPLDDRYPEDLRSLCNALLRRDPAARPGWPEIQAALLPARRTPAPAVVPSPLRVREREALAEVLEQTRAGCTAVLLLHGPSGIGKSALTQSFLGDLSTRPGHLVLAGRCYAHESVPYKAVDPLIDQLAVYLHGLSPAERAPLLPDDLGALVRLFPVLAAFHPSPLAGAPVVDPQEQRRRAFFTLRELLARVGRRRLLVLSIDDLHWGDSDSAALLAECIRPPDPPPLLLLASYRTEESSSVAVSSVAAACPARGSDVVRRELEVGHLEPAEALELVRSLLPGAPGEQAERLVRESDGHPFLLTQLAALAGDPGNGAAGRPTVERALARRLARLSPAESRFLQVLSVAGYPVSIGAARRAADLAGETSEVLGALSSARLIQCTGWGAPDLAVVYHDRIRQTALAELDQGSLEACHLALADALEAEGTTAPETLAAHLEAAGRKDRAFGYVRQAAERATAALAFERAAHHLERCLKLGAYSEESRRQLLTQLADTLALAGLGRRSGQAYLDAAEGAAPEQASRLRRRAFEELVRAGYVDEGLAVMHELLADARLPRPRTPSGVLASLLWARARLRVRGLGFTARDFASVPGQTVQRTELCLSAATGLSLVDNMRGAVYQSRAVELALDLGDPVLGARALALEACFESTGGLRARPRIDQLIERGEALIRDVDSPYVTGWLHTARGLSAYQQGRFREAVPQLERAIAVWRGRCNGVFWELGSCELMCLWGQYYLGELRAMRERAQSLLGEARDRGDVFLRTVIDTGLPTTIWLAADRPDEALGRIDEAMAGWSRQGFHLEHYWALIGRAAALLYQGNGAAALSLIDAQHKGVRGALLLQVQAVRIELIQLRGRAAIAAGAGATGAARAALLARASADARRLRREATPPATAFALALEAGVAATAGQLEPCLVIAAQAREAFAAQGLSLFAAGVAHLESRVLGARAPAEGERAIEDAALSQDLVAPARFLSLLVPGGV